MQVIPNEPNTSTRPSSSEFLNGLRDFRTVTFITHINPDPDGLGGMLGLSHLVETALHKQTRLTRDGLIGRAENRAMVELLDIELIPLDDLEWRDDDALVMVDSQPKTGRHSLHPDIPIYAVIDHHDTPGDVAGIPFIDVRHNLGATCTLVVKYLLERYTPIPERVATALLYGIETEIGGLPREATILDDSALHFLFPLADKEMLAQIRNAPLRHSYFECMLQALQSSFRYDRLIISWVHDLPQPEMAAQVADFLIRFDQVDWAFCAGVFQDQMILSVRSAIPRGRAGEKLREVVGILGRAGGHDRRAGGFIRLASTSATAVEQMQSELRQRWLRILDIDERRGQRLVPVREMLENIS